ncbi:MAG TPA: flagellar motor protein MotB [Rhizorhapis sp.]
MSVVRRTRWAISFADLCLLLLGFFVLLQANSQDARNVMTHVSQYFGGKPQAGRIDFLAADLFEPGEAMLTARGRRLLLRIGKQASEKKGKIEITSIGQDRAGHRFDDWELAAARLAAAARPLREAGLPDDRIELRGLDDRIDAGVDPDAGQHILFRQKE